MKTGNRFFNLIILFAITFLIGFAACNDSYNYFNVKEALAAEQELLERYYDEEMDNGLSRLDSLTAASIDTVDHRFESGLMMFHTELGEKDQPVEAYKTVGFRYTNYAIALQMDTLVDGVDTTFVEKTVEVFRESNEYAISPFTFTTYPVGGVPGAGSNVFPGVNEAVLHMNLFGKAKLVLPSLIADNQYNTHIFELEVTYLEQ